MEGVPLETDILNYRESKESNASFELSVSLLLCSCVEGLTWTTLRLTCLKFLYFEPGLEKIKVVMLSSNLL